MPISVRKDADTTMLCFHCRNSRAAAKRGGALRLLADSQAGFTIIEVVISAVLVALIAGGAATALIASGNFSADQRRRSQADEIAQQDQERLRGMSTRQLTSLPTTPRNVGPYEGTTYQVVSSGKYLSSTGAGTCASSGTGAAAYVKIRSEVDWASNARTPVVQESVVTPPTGGTLLTNVKDQNNAALSGVTVTAAGPDAESAVTDSEGCTVFGGLTSGDYDVTVTKSGYVDPDGNLSPSIPSSPATVSGSGTSYPSPNPFQIGQAGAIQASFTANNGALTNQRAPSLSVSNSGRALPLITIPGSPAGPITTSTTLFPFTTAYTVWAGQCTGEQPPLGTNRIAMSVGPGALATTPAVKEPALYVNVQYPSGTNVKPAQIKLTYAQTAGGTCTESWLPAINTALTLPANGWLASPGQPFAGSTTVGSTTYNGAYTVCASYDTNGATAGGVRWGAKLNQSNSNFTSATTVPTIVISTTDSPGTSGPNACP